MTTATSGQQRHRMIERAMLRRPGAPADAGILLWDSLTDELTQIIGKRGFESLFARSLNRACVEFPWLAPSPPHAGGESPRQVALGLNGRADAEAQAAGTALLIIFTDTLILLIGELLTDGILHKAWGDDVMGDAGTEYRT